MAIGPGNGVVTWLYKVPTGAYIPQGQMDNKNKQINKIIILINTEK